MIGKILDRAGLKASDVALWRSTRPSPGPDRRLPRIRHDEELVNVSGSGCSLGTPDLGVGCPSGHHPHQRPPSVVAAASVCRPCAPAVARAAPSSSRSRTFRTEQKAVGMSDAVLVERRGRALIITINRPEVRNAMNLAVAQGVADAVDELDNSPELSVAVITGAGGNFSAGMDLKAFAKGSSRTSSAAAWASPRSRRSSRSSRQSRAMPGRRHRTGAGLRSDCRGQERASVCPRSSAAWCPVPGA